VDLEQDFDTIETFDAVTYWEDYAADDWDEGNAPTETGPVGGDD
jgi:hypothetical protein